MPDEPLIDRLVDATYRSGDRRIASDPRLSAMHARIKRRPEPKRKQVIDRFGLRHPVLGGALAAVFVVVCFFPMFSIPLVMLLAVGIIKVTGFAFLEGLLALVCVVVGIWMGIVCGRVWYQGQTP